MSFASSTSRKTKILALLPFAPALVVATAVAARFGFMVATCCWAAGFLAMKAYLSLGRYQLRRKFVLTLLTVLAALVVFTVAIDIIRMSRAPDPMPSRARIQGTVFGYLSVFSSWMETGQYDGPWFGIYTIAGPFDLLGIRQRELGLYDGVVDLDPATTSNIYTAFRGLIQDFSLPGTIVVSLLMGFLAGRAYTQACRGKIRWLVPVAAYYAFYIWSPMVSIFNYNGVILAWMVCPFLLRRGAPRIMSAQSTRRIACQSNRDLMARNC